MDMIPRNNYGERCQFDAYCKLVLYHEEIDYLREMQRRRDRELSFSDLPQMEMGVLVRSSYMARYPSEDFCQPPSCQTNTTRASFICMTLNVMLSATR